VPGIVASFHCPVLPGAGGWTRGPAEVLSNLYYYPVNAHLTNLYIIRLNNLKNKDKEKTVKTWSTAVLKQRELDNTKGVTVSYVGN